MNTDEGGGVTTHTALFIDLHRNMPVSHGRLQVRNSYRGYVREGTWALAVVWCNICRLLLKRLHVLKQPVSFSHWEMSLEGSCIDIYILSTEFLSLSEVTDLGLKSTLLDSGYFLKGICPLHVSLQLLLSYIFTTCAQGPTCHRNT